MGQIDDFILAQVNSQLVEGEQIAYVGLVRQPVKTNTLGVPQIYEDWLCGATNFRIFLFLTEPSGVFSLTPKPMRIEDRVWWYQDLREVTTGTVTGVGDGVTIGLIPHEPLGPFAGKAKRYDAVSKAQGCDSQVNLHQHLGPWLQQQVAAGAFPMDAARQATVAAHYEQQRLEAEQKMQADAEKRRQRDEKIDRAKEKLKGGLGLLIAAIVALLATGGAAAMTFNEHSRIAEYQNMASDAEVSAKSGSYGARERARQAGRAVRLHKKKSSIQTMTYVYGVGTVLMLLFTVLATVLYIRKRKAAPAPA
jgi:hypothetical protein